MPVHVAITVLLEPIQQHQGPTILLYVWGVQVDLFPLVVVLPHLMHAHYVIMAHLHPA